jgi:hypothetical protein
MTDAALAKAVATAAAITATTVMKKSFRPMLLTHLNCLAAAREVISTDRGNATCYPGGLQCRTEHQGTLSNGGRRCAGSQA